MTRSRGAAGVPPFRKGDPKAAEYGRKGGKVSAEARRRIKAPYRGTIIDLMDAAGCTGPTWVGWRTFWKAVYALPMSAEELVLFRRHTERDAPPTEPVKEAVMCVGRRGGKSRNAALGAVYAGICFDRALVASGELVTVPLLARDRMQARQLIKFVNALCDLPLVRPFVSRKLRSVVELKTGVNLEITTAGFRGTRGYSSPMVVADEIAYWATEDDSANPDLEVLSALLPTMATIPNSLLLMLSSPYAAVGELFAAVERSFGVDDSYCLVWNSDSLSMHPNETLRRDVERRWVTDPVRAASEYGRDHRVIFRSPLEGYVEADVVAASTVAGRLELPPLAGINYAAFCDPSGASRDSFSLAVGHLEAGGRAVLDLVRERKPPFSPDSVVAEYAAVLDEYHCTDVTADRYAAAWVVEAFERHGIKLLHSALPKSDLYAELLGPLNSGRIELLDNAMLHTQLLRLERRTGTGGRDRIDHRRGGKDDLINSAAGALVLALGVTGRKKKRSVVWSLGADHVGGLSTAEPNPHKAALETLAAEYKRRGLQDPTTVPGSVTTRVFCSYPETPPGWMPDGDPVYDDNATPEFRRATGGTE